MSIGRSFEESLLKGIRSLQNKVDHLEIKSFKDKNLSELLDIINLHTDERIYAIAEAFRKHATIDEIHEITNIDRFFLDKIKNIVELEEKVKQNIWD